MHYIRLVITGTGGKLPHGTEQSRSAAIQELAALLLERHPNIRTSFGYDFHERVREELVVEIEDTHA